MKMKKYLFVLAAILVSGILSCRAEHITVTLQQAGVLEKTVGNDILSTDSLTVKGPVNLADTKFMAKGSMDGRLVYLDMSGAQVENGILSSGSFLYVNGTPYGTKFKTIILPDDITEFEPNVFMSMFFLKEINIPASLRIIGRGCFGSCRELNPSNFVFPEGIEEIPKSCFADCVMLTEVTLPSTLKTIDSGAFYNCNSLSKINFPENLETIGDMAFANCALEEVIMPESCTSFFGTGHFFGNLSLKKVHFPSELKTIPSAIFSSCGALETVEWPAELTSISLAAFEDCESLKEITFPDKLETVGMNAFSRCDELERITFPKSLRTIEAGAFNKCSALREVNFSEGLEHIFARAFTDCNSMQSWAFPSTLIYLDIYCLDLPNLKSIYCAAEEAPECYEINGVTRSANRDIPVYIPIGATESYRRSPAWYNFTNFIETTEFPTLSGVDEINTTKEDTGEYYDLKGKRISHPEPGNIYIHRGSKVIFTK